MSLEQIPGSVTFRRQWPLGIVLALLGAVLFFAFDTRAGIADLEKRAAKLEAKEEKRAENDRRVAQDIATIKAHVEAIRELLREDRRHRP